MVRKKNLPQPKEIATAGLNLNNEQGTCSQNNVSQDSDIIIDDSFSASEEDEDYMPTNFLNRRFRKLSNCYVKSNATVKKKKKQKLDYGEFQDILNNSLCRVEVHQTKCEEAPFLLGSISIKIEIEIPSNLFDQCKTFWAYICKTGLNSALYFEWTREAESCELNAETEFKHFVLEDDFDRELWLSMTSKKFFYVHMVSYNDMEMTLNIYLMNSGIHQLNHPSDLKVGNKSLSKVMEKLYGIKIKESIGNKVLNHDPDILFQHVRRHHVNRTYSDIDPQHSSLLPVLRPYQKDAVKWMLFKEKPHDNISSTDLHPLYLEVRLTDGNVLYFNVTGGFFVKDKPVKNFPYPGGILADEMGLGKTVEVLSCMLCNPRMDLEDNKDSRILQHSENSKVIEIGSDSDTSLESDELSNEYENLSSSSDGEKFMKSYRKVRKTSKVSSCDDSSSDSSVEVIIKRKRKPVSYKIDSDDDYSDQSSKKKKLKPIKTKPVEFDVEVHIKEDPVLQSIEGVVLEYCWENKLPMYKKHGSRNEYHKFLRMRRIDPCYDMSMKERLDYSYRTSLQQYSAAECVAQSSRIVKDFFETKVKQKNYFECICGDTSNSNNLLKKVQCKKCGLYQHAKCVQFNLKSSSEYVCPHCWTTEKPIPSAATLIIAPSTITYQWVDEIKKHLKKKSIHMVVYNGVAKESYIQPSTLAAADIVITAYETLKKELDYVDLPHSNSEAGRRFRYPKRFMATPSPLPCIQWWRICLDEAQMVENQNRAAEMALRLSGVNRWCVTGTPVQKSVDDLQGLLLFLGVDPYGEPHWWKKCVFEPFCYGNQENLLSIMSEHMWRNSKKDVEQDLGIPTQTEEIHWLQFTPVETHFYRRLHNSCSQEFHQKLSKFSDLSQKISDLDRKTFSFLLQPLLKLRQACNHPQVVKGEFSASVRKNMTMEELLEHLVQKTKQEAEDTHRTIVASLNGLAALNIIDKSYIGAAEKYREALKSIEEHSDCFKSDSLQKLHILHNLHEIIEVKTNNIPPTLRDSELLKEATGIRENYLKQYPIRMKENQDECHENTNSIKELETTINNKTDWFIIALESYSNDFVVELRAEILSQYSHFEQKKCILYPVHSRVQLLQLLSKHSKNTVKQRNQMIDSIHELVDVNPSTLLESAIDCHLRPTDDNPIKCRICKVHDLIESYEESLFPVKEAKKSRETERAKETEDVKEKAQVLLASRKGHWGCNDIERTLKYIQTKGLSTADPLVLEDSQIKFQILQAMKKEFKNYRILWRSIFDHVSAHDEVNMATLRLRLRYPGEKVPEVKEKKNVDQLTKKTERPSYIIERDEVLHQAHQMNAQLLMNQPKLKNIKNQLLYLQNLQKKSSEGISEPCPVCQGELGKKWAVYNCSHSFCLDCTVALSKQVAHTRECIKCPLCRQPTKVNELNFVQVKVEDEENTIKIQGSLSTKMEGVVRVMLKIKEVDPQAKVLIFSTWAKVLEVIGDSLAQNGILHRNLLNHNKFQESLSSFKASQEITALLLQIHSGANGLNLTEASHIILVEPILNLGEELQALGRIHRIGQTKPTKVHRFIVKNTIEERMYNNMPTKPLDSTGQDSLTISDIGSLFDGDQFQLDEIPLDLVPDTLNDD